MDADRSPPSMARAARDSPAPGIDELLVRAWPAAETPADRQVAQLYLAVMADNIGARRLYEAAGFTTDHTDSYWAPT
jgi:ribosomal protein S18 acetylase RimI-like enzyme